MLGGEYLSAIKMYRKGCPVRTPQSVIALFLFSLLMTLFGAAGCNIGGQGDPPAGPPSNSTTGHATITVDDGTDPVEGASVTLAGDTKTTDADGHAIFSDVATGDYTVTASKSGYADGSAEIKISQDQATTATISIGPAGGAKITVNDGTALLSGAVVTLNGNTLNTDNTGVVTFADVPVGEHTASAVKSGYTSGSAKVTVAANAVAEATISLVRQTGAATITVDDGAHPISGASVTLGAQTLSTGADGLVTFSNVPTGPYAVSASKVDFDSNTVTITVANQTTVTATIALSRQTGNVVIFVRQNPNYQAISGASVTLDERTVTTSSDGRADFAGVPTGTYNATVSAAVFQTKTVSVTVTAGGSYSCDVLMDRKEGQVVLTALRTSNGSPVVGATVHMYYPATEAKMPTSPTITKSGTTDANGQVIFADGVVIGDWWIVVAPNEALPPVGSLHTVTADTVIIPITSMWW